MELSQAFGLALRELRERKQLSQQAFVGVISREHMSRLERGVSLPNLAVVVGVAEVLGVHPMSLMALCFQEMNGGEIQNMLHQVELDLSI
ncbi:helix-turn-helix domain-containing protein [Pseudomonas sp. GG8]